MEGNDLRDFLRELVEFLKTNEISEFELEQTDLKVRLKFTSAPAAPAVEGLDMQQLGRLMNSMQTPAPAAAQVAPAHMHTTDIQATSAPVSPAEPEVKNHVVKSPIVGTFYDSPSPGSPPFVKIGDQVEVGQVLCIVEAMKLMNDIESDAAGEVMERIAASGQPVEYGQPLFAIKPR